MEVLNADQVQIKFKQNYFAQLSIWLSCKAQTDQTFPLVQSLRCCHMLGLLIQGAFQSSQLKILQG